MCVLRVCVCVLCVYCVCVSYRFAAGQPAADLAAGVRFTCVSECVCVCVRFVCVCVCGDREGGKGETCSFVHVMCVCLCVW